MTSELLDRKPIEVLPSGGVSRREAARYLGRGPNTLARWATHGVGPPFVLVQRRAFYRLEDLQRMTAGSPDAPPSPAPNPAEER